MLIFGIMSNNFILRRNQMIKYILGLIIILAIILVAVTVGANNDQVITFNYILFGLGLILGWFITGVFYLKLKLKNIALNRQIKRQTQQINELTTSRDKAPQ